MSDKAFEKVTEYIDALAAKLGVAAEHVYGLMVRQQIAEGIIDLIVIVIALILGFVFCRHFGKLTKNKLDEAKRKWVSDISDDIVNFLNYAFWVTYLLFVIVAIIAVPSDIMKIINPEYYAIKDLLEALAG